MALANMEKFLELPGVGRKTANCVLVYGFNKPSIPVDTHVHRLSNRLGLVNTRTPEATELDGENTFWGQLWVSPPIKCYPKKADKTVFICTHLLDTAEELCDIIGIIINGELKAEGTPREIIESVGAKDLEDAYLKITGATHIHDLLAWRNGNFNNVEYNKEKGTKKKKSKKSR